ncbi:iron-sulfur cluster biosynthesis family protein [Paenibacillus sp. J5C_2022]|uniref:iron-sulfur cluster biosynthesis family protein n=1 Tax=Paenibacillus sp. J5C2022 TaxID=2977129 RepID=UPI0021CDF659|nr:iron-sulfur cluster biosynthesis family protein [Paenibacillus sp. J5C2022]MCU6708228.1 iron-sulfur cluster biosynthesis family protein [Paenibacillus sp. J5C2022]
MIITFTDSAVRKLAPYLEEDAIKLKFLHDTEGCGCVVSGVPALQLVVEPSQHDSEGEGRPLPFLYERRHEVFYEPSMRIDYDAARDTFSLKSDNQIYTTSMRFMTAP